MKTQHFHIPASLKLEIEIDVLKEQVTQSVVRHSASDGIGCQVRGASKELAQTIQHWLKDYADQRQPTVRLPLSLLGIPPFISRVLWALHEVPFGQTLSYGQMAAYLHQPKAARAVGQACGRNPLILFIPCHRVLAANGRLGGFSADCTLKPLLLTHELVEHKNGRWASARSAAR